jgi:selenocysteine-specific elongation factor
VRVVATAGHVDHGKSTLVLTLTGTDPDRFAEEKRRGLTIDLGFAHTTVVGASGAAHDISFIDVPGHVRFLRNMLAGVGGVTACVFVVAATEGWKPQSEEHLRILELLGIGSGLIALTKSDLVDDDLLVDPGGAGVAEVRLQRGPGRHAAALQHADLREDPRRVADRQRPQGESHRGVESGWRHRTVSLAEPV